MATGITIVTNQAPAGPNSDIQQVEIVSAPDVEPGDEGKHLAVATVVPLALEWVEADGGGVTSVAMSVPSILSVAGSPITTTGTLAVSLATQSANSVFAGPTTGGASTPTFRPLVAADLPSTAVTPGSYTNTSLTIDAQGRVTAASTGAGGSEGLAYNTVALLRAASVPADNTRCTLLGYYAAFDGGGGDFYYDAQSTATEDGGAVITPAGGTGRWLRIFTQGMVNARWFGAIGDRSSHPLSGYYASLGAAQAVYPHAEALTDEIDWAATQAAANYLKTPYPDPELGGRNVVGGRVRLDRGIFVMNKTLDFNSVQRFSLILCGIGGKGAPGSIFKGGASMIMYTGADDRFIDMRSSYACGVEDLTIWYNNAAFRGALIDFSWGETENDSFASFVRRCTLSGDPGTWPDISYPSAKCLISLWNAITCYVTDCLFGIAESGIRFREFVANRQPYSNAHVVRDCTFMYERWNLVNPGEMITVEGCTFEGLGGFTEAAVYDDTQRSVAEPECEWTWDSGALTLTRSSGSWVDDGFTIGMTPFCLNRNAAGVNQANTGNFSAITNVTATVLTFTDDSIGGIVGVTEWTDGVTSTIATLSAASVLGAPYGAFARASAGVELVFSGNTITRNNGSWIEENWQVGYQPSISGTSSNDGAKTAITTLTDTVMTLSGTTFVGETATAGVVFHNAGFGTFTFRANWLGDQFLPGSCWLRFYNQAAGVVIENNFFAGAWRCAEFHGGAGAINFVGNHLTSALVPVYFNPLSPGWGSTVFSGNQAAGELYEGDDPASRVWCIGNDTDATTTDSVDSLFAQFKVRGAIVDVGRSENFTSVDGFFSAAFGISQGGGSLGIGMGCDASRGMTQVYGAPYVAQPFGQSMGVGKTPENSKFEVAGDIEVDATYGYILRSPNGTRYRIAVANDGTLSASAA